MANFINENEMDKTIGELIATAADAVETIDVDETSFNQGFERAFMLNEPRILQISYSELGITNDVIRAFIKLQLEERIFDLLTMKLREEIHFHYPQATECELTLIERIVYPRVHDSLMYYLSGRRDSKYFKEVVDDSDDDDAWI